MPVELPELPEGGGLDGLVRAVQQRVQYPRAAQRNGTQGQNRVTFAVAPDGRVCLIKITRALTPETDSAVVRAVRQMPRLVPAKQLGKPVACLMSAPVTFCLTPILVNKKILPAADSTQLYTAVSQIPIYQGKFGQTKLAADLVTQYMHLATASGCSLPQMGLAVLVTIGPRGNLYDVEVSKVDELQNAALKTAFGDAVAHYQEEELSAACVALLEQAARRLPLLLPAYADGKRVAMRMQLTLRQPAN